MFFLNKDKMPEQKRALKGRDEAISIRGQHVVLGSSIQPPFPEGSEQLVVGMGCFWGSEKCFWSLPGVLATAVGYSAGYTPNPTYDEVCSGRTGHNEVVLIVYQPEQISTTELLHVFWESHNPTQGMRQGNDRGTQYRSGIYYSTEEQQQQAEHTLKQYQSMLQEKLNQSVEITTEILPAETFYYAEEYHQQYLAKNPNGYCGLGGLGISLCSADPSIPE